MLLKWAHFNEREGILIKGEAFWKGGPISFLKVTFLLTDLGSGKSFYENLIESPKKFDQGVNQ